MNIPLEKQVKSQGLSQRIKNLGAPQESYFYWTTRKGFAQSDEFYVSTYNTCLSAWGCAELGERLPAGTVWWKVKEGLFMCKDPTGYEIKSSEFLAEAMGLMYEHLIKIGVIKI